MRLRFASLMVGVLIAAALLPQNHASAQSTAVQRITPATQIVSVSQSSFDVIVTVESVTNLGGYETLVTFDSAAVTFISATDSTFLGSTGRTVFCPPPVIQPLAGTLRKLRFGCGTLGPTPPPGVDGAGPLAIVSFQPLTVGLTNLDLDPSLSDPFGGAINATAVGGQVDINAGPTATPTLTPTPTVTPTPCTGACPTATPTACTSPVVQVANGLVGSPNIVLAVPVTVQGACDVGAFSISLAYDAALLTFSNAQLGPFLGSSGRSAQCASPIVSAGSVAVSCVTLGSPPPAGANGSGVLATLEFVPTTLGSSALTLSNVALLTPAADPIPATATSGSVTISACSGVCTTVTPTPSPTATLTPTQTTPPSATPSPTPCAGTCPTPVIATATPTLAVVPAQVFIDQPTYQAQQGSAFSIGVSVSNAVNMGAFSFVLQFDPAIVSVQSATVRPFLTSSGRTAFCGLDIGPPLLAPGLARFSCGTLGDALGGASGGGGLATLSLMTLAPGTSALDLINVALLTPPSGTIPIGAVTGASVTVTACGGLCPTSTPTIAASPTATPTPGGVASVGIAPSVFNVSPGDTFSVDVTVSAVTNLGAFEIIFQDNTAPPFFVEFVSAQLGPFPGSTGRPVVCQAPIVTVINVRYACATTGTGALGPSGSGLLATLTFHAVNFGSSTEFGVTSADLTDPLANSIAVQLGPLGSITSLPPTPTNTPPGGTILGAGRSGPGDSSRSSFGSALPGVRDTLAGSRAMVFIALGAIALAAIRIGRTSRRYGARAALVAIITALLALPSITPATPLAATSGVTLTQSPASANLFVGAPPLTVTQHVAQIPSSAGVAAFAIDLRYDADLVDVTIADGGFLGSTGRPVSCSTSMPSFFERVFSCTSSGNAPLATGQGDLARYTITPKQSAILQLRPSGANSGAFVLGLVAAGTHLFGGSGPIVVDQITSAGLALRALQGDVNRDCVVNGLDLQIVGSHYPSGSDPYSAASDLEPAQGDGDIDVRDLQFVLGRQGSSCALPVPNQAAPQPVTASGAAPAASVGGVAERPDVRAVSLAQPSSRKRDDAFAFGAVAIIASMMVVVWFVRKRRSS